MQKKIAVIDAKLITKDVQKYIDSVASLGMEKKARVVARSYSKDAKLNRFLDADFTKGLGLFVDEKRRNTIEETLANHGLTSIETKQALIASICQGDVDAAVKAKIEEVTDKGKLVLNNEQKEALAKKSIAYRNFLLDKLLPGALELAKTLNLVKYEEPKPAEAAKEVTLVD